MSTKKSRKPWRRDYNRELYFATVGTRAIMMADGFQLPPERDPLAEKALNRAVNMIHKKRKQRKLCGVKAPKPGLVLAKVEHRGTFDVVNTRIVSAIEKRYPRGTVVVYHRRRDRPHKLCRCTLTEWRKWARSARKPAKAWNET